MGDVATTQAFQERMFAKIRDQMGDLMTDDDLRKLVESAMQKAFFEPRRTSDVYGRHTEAPPLFVELIAAQMREQVAKAVSAWVEANPDTVSKAITEAIEKGVFGMVASHIDSKVSVPLWQFGEALRSKGLL